MPKFEIGDRVTRPVDIFADESPLNHGAIVDRYSVDDSKYGPYPEVYAVRWDCGHFERGFLPHGIDAELIELTNETLS